MSNEQATAKFISAADAFGAWHEDLVSGKAPTFYPVGEGELARIEIGPGLVTLIGGAPGAGKTAFTMQLVIDALRMTPTLRAIVCNVEMPPGVLLDRQLARLSGVPLTLIRRRTLDEEHADRIDQGFSTLEALADRLAFVQPPFDLSNIAATADEFGAGLIVLDYIQRIPPPGDHGDRRGSVDATMNYLRQFADARIAFIVVSAVGRGKDRRGGSTYAADALSLASYKESGELEFGADDAFILAPDGDPADGMMILKHLKARHGEALDLELQFDRKRQHFSADGATAPKPAKKTRSRGEKRPSAADLAALWNQTPAAEADAETETEEEA